MYEGLDEFFRTAHERAVDWARGLLKLDPSEWVILDTETTGLGERDEIVQVAMIDGAGKVLFDNVLVKPTIHIPNDAAAIHRISNEMVANALSFSMIAPDFIEAAKGKIVVIYNADYDLRLIRQSLNAHGYGPDWDNVKSFDCAMLQYAAWVGDWNDYYKSFRWQKLPAGDHSALGGCRAVLELIHKMAESKTDKTGE